jgi:hypothetical protein
MNFIPISSANTSGQLPGIFVHLDRRNHPRIDLLADGYSATGRAGVEQLNPLATRHVIE